MVGTSQLKNCRAALRGRRSVATRNSEKIDAAKRRPRSAAPTMILAGVVPLAVAHLIHRKTLAPSLRALQPRLSAKQQQ